MKCEGARAQGRRIERDDIAAQTGSFLLKKKNKKAGPMGPAGFLRNEEMSGYSMAIPSEYFTMVFSGMVPMP